MSLNKEENKPVANKNKPVWELVVQDMLERNEVGTQKYGTPLQANNGRNALVDSYQEALDLVVYLRQKIEEDKSKCSCGCKCGVSDPDRVE